MEEKKNQGLTKKVRFDLNEEVFLIPSKWDRLSKCKSTNARIIEGQFTSKQKSRTVIERRNKNGQSKMSNFSSVSRGKLDLNSESNGASSDNVRPNTSPNKNGNNPGKALRQKNNACENATDKRNSTSPVEAKLKFYHRPPQELPRLDLVLPKISYTPDLKKAFEKALQRSRSRPALETGLHTDTTILSTQEKKLDIVRSIPQQKAEIILQRRLSDSSVRIGKGISTECKQPNRENRSKFSELSSINLDAWSPFSAWSAKDGSVRTNQTPSVTRGRSVSSLIPSSILY